LASWAQKCLKLASRAILRAIWTAEPRNVENDFPETSWEWICQLSPEMLEMSLQKLLVSDLASWTQKCAKRPSRDLRRAIGLAGPGNAWNELPEVDWERFDQPSPEMVKMSLQRHPESDLASRAQKCLKWASRNFLRAIWRVSGWASGHRHYLICICVCVCVCLCLACMCIYVCLCVHERMCVCVSVRVYMQMVVQEYVHVVRVGTLVCGLPLCQCTPQSVSSLGTTYYFSRF
jgi:hypothetical protein